LPNRVSLNASKPNVAIIGAGVIGLGVAWRLAARDASVAVFDKGAAGAGASHAAAGMLAACAEAEPGEQALVALGRESQRRWPAFAAELQQVSGIDVGLRPEGTLVVALTADDQARPPPSARLPAEARTAAAMDFSGGDATTRAAPCRQARERGVQPRGSPGR
jgi:glycine/D-amino acid oxidase-like deaminating enzyme